MAGSGDRRKELFNSEFISKNEHLFPSVRADQSYQYGEAEAGGSQAFKASLDFVGDSVSTMERKEY